MITRFEADGFKSLRNFAVDLAPLTVLVGPNGAGKSNLLEALALLGRLVTMPVEEAFKKGRGRSFDQFSRFGGETSRTIRFFVEFKLNTSMTDEHGASLPNDYRYEVVIERRVRDSGIEELVVADENLSVRKGEFESERLLSQSRVYKRDRKVLLWHESRNDEYRIPLSHTALGAFALRMEVPTISLLPESMQLLDELKREWKLPNRGRALQVLLDVLNEKSEEDESSRDEVKAILERGSQALQAHGITPFPMYPSDVIHAVIDELEKFRLLHLDAARLREPTEKIFSGVLAPDASNLATVLAELPPPILGSIRADLSALIPGLAGFDVVVDGDSLRIDFKLSGGEILPARLASDGTLRALALLTVLTAEPHPSILAIEEPENGIYPGRLRRLLTILTELASIERKTQVLLTTHSPVVVAAFRDKPEWLRVVDIVLRNGQRDTRARIVGKPQRQSDAAHIASLREVDSLLHSADVEVAE